MSAESESICLSSKITPVVSVIEHKLNYGMTLS